MSQSGVGVNVSILGRSLRIERCCLTLGREGTARWGLTNCAYLRGCRRGYCLTDLNVVGCLGAGKTLAKIKVVGVRAYETVFEVGWFVLDAVVAEG